MWLVVVSKFPLSWGCTLPELSRQRRYPVLAVCCMSLFLVGMDSTVVNVALPSTGRDFRAPASPAWYVLLCCVVLGAGMGRVNAPVTNNAVAGMPRARAGTASGIASTSRQVGSSLGVAVTGSVLAAGLHGSVASGFASATRPAWWIVAAMGACVLALAVATTGRTGQASAARAAAIIERADRAAPDHAARAAARAPRGDFTVLRGELGAARSRQPSPRT
jgi:hypothetical protein